MRRGWLKCIGNEADYVQVSHIRTLKKISDNTWHAVLGDYGVNVQATDEEVASIVSQSRVADGE
jgi:hypothetical protein